MPLMFFRVCWAQGVHRALILVFDRFSRWLPSFRRSRFVGADASNVSAYLDLLAVRPKISIVMPVFNSLWLKDAVASVLAQSYGNYELILVNDCSTDEAAISALADIPKNDRIRVIHNAENMGISGATNVGIESSSGEYIAFMDHDDLIHPDALAYFVRILNDGKDPDVFYCDEDIIGAQGVLIDSLKKCPVSMDLLLSCNVVVHFCIMKKSALLGIGLLKSKYDGAQDHELMIRAMEHGLSFFYLPCPLYAWRCHQASRSGEVRAFKNDLPGAYPRTYLNGKKAIQDYLDRNSIKATVEDDAFFWYRVKYALPEDAGEVAVIIPFKDGLDMLRRLLDSMEKTSYKNYVIYLVNNMSEKPETLEYLDGLRGDASRKIKLLDFDEPFNFSRLYNRVVSGVPNEILLFMNNDIEVADPDWLEAMLEHIHREKVGAVGCRLLRKNGSIQHAGMIFTPGIAGCAANLFLEEGFYTKVQRDVTGVTAACMMIRKSVFQAVGGFDEIQFPVGFSDSDLCLKIVKAGYKIIYTPFAELYHYESFTRHRHEECYEKFMLLDRYIGDTPMRDRHYKPC